MTFATVQANFSETFFLEKPDATNHSLKPPNKKVPSLEAQKSCSNTCEDPLDFCFLRGIPLGLERGSFDPLGLRDALGFRVSGWDSKLLRGLRVPVLQA